MKKIEFIESYLIPEDGGDYQWNDNHGRLIRCKDCEWWDSESKEKYRVCHKHNTGWKEDDYCSFADMREGDAE